MGKKILRAACFALALCFAFLSGMMAERQTGFLRGAVDEILASSGDAYVFAEPLIEEAARLMLGTPEGQNINWGDLDGITELFIVGTKAVRNSDEVEAVRQEDRC